MITKIAIILGIPLLFIAPMLNRELRWVAGAIALFATEYFIKHVIIEIDYEDWDWNYIDAIGIILKLIVVAQIIVIIARIIKDPFSYSFFMVNP